MLNLSIAVLLCLCGPAQDDRIQQLIQSLNESSKDVRVKAVDDLVAIGRPALEALRKAATSSDLEVKGLAVQAVERIEWLGLEKLKKYARETLDENASVELSKLKGLSRWFPDARFYEVTAAGAGNGQAAMMGMAAPRCLFALRKFEDGFYRLIVRGIVSPRSIGALLQKSKVVLADEDAALDFAIAYLELQSAGSPQNAAMMMGGGVMRLERTPEGWSLVANVYGTATVLKTDKDGVLLDIVQKTNIYNNFNPLEAEERAKLEVEKLKLEIEALKRQVEKK
jgi:hypothetical protein